MPGVAIPSLFFGFSLGTQAVVRYGLIMPRRLRIESEGALYHLMARANAMPDKRSSATMPTGVV
jgi:hypothetical protein